MTSHAAAKRALLELRKELEAMLQQSRKDAQPVDLSLPIGRVSRIDAIQQQNMVAAGRRRAQLRLAQVQSALKRIETDDYGYCVECDEEISAERLEARPEAPLCLGCQSAFEGEM